MGSKDIEQKIKSSFEKHLKKNKKIKSSFLLVYSEKHEIDITMAQGTVDKRPAEISQPVYMASVGKLFTATVIAILRERGQLDFGDTAGTYLDSEIMDKLHFYKGRDYSEHITIRHLLMQTSGLYDTFYHLLNKMIKESDFQISPREAVLWGKENLKPTGIPGERHSYTDTNYYLLGLIIEKITGMAFHEVLHDLIFEPAGMQHAYMHGFSKPKLENGLPVAEAYFKNRNILSIKNYHQIDYAGGGVVAPLSDYLLFMQALTDQKLITNKTLGTMVEDSIKIGFPVLGFDYGYSVWKMKKIPLLVPETYQCRGCVGATGAFSFYHPATDSYIIGTFNDFAQRSKALQFMANGIIKQLVKCL